MSSNGENPWLVWVREINDARNRSRPRPSAASDIDDPALAEIRYRIVEPVFRGILRQDEELETVRVQWLENFDDGYVEVFASVAGESYQQTLWVDRVPADTGPLSLEQVENAADRLADLLEDWVCETRFGWGEQRTADYELPDAQLGGE